MRAGCRNPSERRAAQAPGNSEQPGPIQSSNAMTPQRPPGWKGRSSRLSATRPVWPGHDGGNRLGGRVGRPAPTKEETAQTLGGIQTRDPSLLAPQHPGTESSTADSPAPPSLIAQPPVPQPPAPEPASTGKLPVGRRVATLATSALVAMRLRRPTRRPADPPE